MERLIADRGDLAPAYISELISVRDTGRYDLRSSDGLLLAPCKHL